MNINENHINVKRLQKENWELKRAVDELIILNEIAVAISSSMTLDAILKSIIKKCLKHFFVDQASVMILDRENKTQPFRTVIRTADSLSESLPYRLDTQLSGWMINNMKPLIINNFTEDERFDKRPEEEMPIRSILCVPLMIKNTLIGLIALFNKKADEKFSANEQRLLSIIAAQSAHIIENARLHAEETKIKNEKIASDKANRMKSEFLANMSHEIRTPLNSVIGFSELLINRMTDPKNIEYLNSIIVSGRNLMDLINDILDLSKIEAGRLELTYELANLFEIIEDISRIFNLKINEKGLDFNIYIDKKAQKYIITDEPRLKQVLVNLITNAVKFTNQGFINLSVKSYSIKNNLVDLIFEISDSGIGIPKKYLEEIFDAFTQRKVHKEKDYEGTGLGLAITKKIVERMGGVISVESIEGEGSRFVILLKDVEVSRDHIHQKEKENEQPIENIAFEEATILLVEDKLLNRLLIKEYLTEKNLRIIEAIDGNEAIEALEKEIPNLILMDLKMPNMDGFEAIKIIKSKTDFKNIPVVAMTASAMKEDQEKIKKAGFDNYILKPIHKETVFKKLIEYLPFSYEKADESFDINSLSNEIPALELPISLKQSISSVINKLNTEYYNNYIELSKSLKYNAINDFARELMDYGNGTGIKMISLYANKLSSECASFDRKKIKSALEGFPLLISNIERLSENHK